jgi:hypothetical protein
VCRVASHKIARVDEGRRCNDEVGIALRVAFVSSFCPQISGFVEYQVGNWQDFDW